MIQRPLPTNPWKRRASGLERLRPFLDLPYPSHSSGAKIASTVFLPGGTIGKL